MHFGFSLGRVRPRFYRAIASRADELGFESLWVPEHLVFPADLRSASPYAPPGSPPLNPDTPALDPFALLSHLAAVTQRIRLGTAVYILPLRNPFVTARGAVTVDMLSGGRFILGVGVGWLKEEFEIVGEPWENRGARSVEIVHILRKLWADEVIDYQGRFYQFAPARFRPKPRKSEGIPIHFGGVTSRALRRAAEAADGWIGVQHSVEEARTIAATLDSLRRQANRLAVPFEVTVAPSEPLTPSLVERYAEAGVTRLTVRPWTRPEAEEMTEAHHLEDLATFAATFLSR